MNIIALLDRLFRHEYIGDPDGGVYLDRWVIARAFGCALYLHRFRRSDWTRDLHDHPRSFWTLPLWSGYWEVVDCKPTWVPRGNILAVYPIRTVRWPWPRFRRAEHRHRIDLIPGRARPWTLVLMLRKRRTWGFWVDGSFVPAREYLRAAGY